MSTSTRVLMATAAAVLGLSPLHAESGPWGLEVGAVLPSGGSKSFVGTCVGPSIDVMQSFALTTEDAVRMRFAYWALKASSGAPDTLTVPGAATASYPASTTNQLFAFTYGAEYVRSLPARFYVLGGLGVTYLTATRQGTWNLSSAGLGAASSNYSANNFVPYFTLGAGYQITGSIALEGRWQTSTMRSQYRPLDLSSIGAADGQVTFDKLQVSTLTVGLVLTF
jgi:hypothetical protein